MIFDNAFKTIYECKACGAQHDVFGLDKPIFIYCEICDDFWCEKCAGGRTIFKNKYDFTVCSNCKADNKEHEKYQEI